jgi:hypothetical protein
MLRKQTESAVSRAPPSLRRGGAVVVPRKAGDEVKTDRRDAMILAQLLRAGPLTEVWVPDEAHEALRDLVRMRGQRELVTSHKLTHCHFLSQTLTFS